MKKFFITGVLGLSLLAAGLAPVAVQGQSLQELMDKQNQALTGKHGANIKARDPRVIVAYIIRVMLSLTGTIFVIYTVYGGYLIMTAAGEEAEITKAKSIFRQSIIGIIITLSAYSIAFFVYGMIWKAEQNPFGDFMFWGVTPDNSGFYNKDKLENPISIPDWDNLPTTKESDCAANPNDPACPN